VKTPPSRLAAFAAAGILAVAAALRLFRLDAFSYGLDEILQTYWMTGSWHHFWESVRFDAVHPPLSYLLARVVELLAPSDAARKIPAVLFGVATVALFGALMARRAGRRAGLLAGALLALAPFHVRFSQELRPYPLALFTLCLALLLLDAYLARPNFGRLVGLYFAVVAAVYTLYLSQVVLAIAAGAMLWEDAFAENQARRQASRRFLGWSPLFAGTVFLAYLPWWPIQLEALARPAVEANPLTVARVDRIFSFFFFAARDGDPLGPAGLLYAAIVAAGVAVALRQPGTRFLVAWAVLGAAAIETLYRLHPHYDVSRIYLPAGIAFCALAAVALDRLARRGRVAVVAAGGLVALLLLFDARSLGRYYREGRADWRNLARFVAARPEGEWIFAESGYAQLCIAFYAQGPDWAYRRGPGMRNTQLVGNIWKLGGDLDRLKRSWKPGQKAWLVLSGVPKSDDLRKFAESFEYIDFPEAEGSRLVVLDPARREQAFRGVTGR
jgi:4-amino-4-deoxy-L-arabinose transferase-like glycosyltransferase